MLLDTLAVNMVITVNIFHDYKQKTRAMRQIVQQNDGPTSCIGIFSFQSVSFQSFVRNSYGERNFSDKCNACDLVQAPMGTLLL